MPLLCVFSSHGRWGVYVGLGDFLFESHPLPIPPVLSSLLVLMGLLEGVGLWRGWGNVGGAASTNTVCTAATMCNCDLCVNVVGLGPERL